MRGSNKCVLTYVMLFFKRSNIFQNHYMTSQDISYVSYIWQRKTINRDTFSYYRLLQDVDIFASTSKLPFLILWQLCH